nr:hypothetical protein [Prosthecochloris sp. CIB 2401]
MKIIDNINSLLGDDLKASIRPQSKLQIAASCFSIYAYEALKSELSKIDHLEFIFTEPTFVPNQATGSMSQYVRCAGYSISKQKKVGIWKRIQGC